MTRTSVTSLHFTPPPNRDATEANALPDHVGAPTTTNLLLLIFILIVSFYDFGKRFAWWVQLVVVRALNNFKISNNDININEGFYFNVAAQR